MVASGMAGGMSGAKDIRAIPAYSRANCPNCSTARNAALPELQQAN